MNVFTRALLLGCFSIVATDAFASSRDNIVLYKSMLPKHFMLVDKKEQRCSLYGVQGKEEPLSYTCSSGQVDGDKIIEGDKKTPVGAYFVTGSILEGLNFEEYGSRAYPLNYPNPIDSLEKKTGYGIWVHGKGSLFKEKGTRGCVAFPEKDILKVYSNFIVSYPVIIGESVVLEEGEPSEDYSSVQEATLAWAKDWTEQSASFFTHYDKSKRENYSRFQSNKQRIFSLFPFTFVSIDKPYIVRKGNYYTTWFRQYYYAPNMLVEGTRYLYWELDSQGTPHIIAEEWKANTSSKSAEQLLNIMKPGIETFITQWKKAWESGDISAYLSMYSSSAIQGNLRGKNAIAKSKERNWKRNPPKNITIENMRFALTQNGIQVRFKQIYQAGSQYKDIGEKTLYILPSSSSSSHWKIAKEMWVRSH